MTGASIADLPIGCGLYACLLPTIGPPFDPIAGTLTRAVLAAGALGNNTLKLMPPYGAHQIRERHVESLREGIVSGRCWTIHSATSSIAARSPRRTAPERPVSSPAAPYRFAISSMCSR